MSIMKKFTLLCIGLIASLQVSAAPFWKFHLNVAYMIVDSSGGVQVMFFENGAVYKPCENVEYYKFKMSEPGAEAMNSYLLTAYATKRKVSVVLDCSGHILTAVRLDIDGV